MSQRTYYSEEAKQKETTKRNIIVATFLVIGATIGTALAILFAPQSGEETREEISEAMHPALQKLQKQIDELRKRFDDLTP